MEKRDLYDCHRNLTGETIFKGDPIPKDRYILVVISIIRNAKGEFLIQKASPQKDGKYACTGGHPKSGQTSKEGIIEEIQEELGLDVSSDPISLFYSDHNDKVFCDLYYLEKEVDLNTLVLQKEEVDSIAWMKPEEIVSLDKKGLFRKSHLEAIQHYYDILG